MDPLKIAAGALLAIVIFGLSIYLASYIFPPVTYIFSSTTITTSTTTTLPPDETAAWLETRVHELINAERSKAGLENLTWNAQVASVARMHSADMAAKDYFEHTNLEGMKTGDRLKASSLYYWNMSGENIFKASIVDYFIVDRFNNIRDTKYKTLDQFAEEAVSAWMNSTGHRENILEPRFNEDGVGVADDGNNTYYFTQDFITRTGCGYYAGQCCPAKLPYMPWCYVPYKCRSGSCS